MAKRNPLCANTFFNSRTLVLLFSNSRLKIAEFYFYVRTWCIILSSQKIFQGNFLRPLPGGYYSISARIQGNLKTCFHPPCFAHSPQFSRTRVHRFAKRRRGEDLSTLNFAQRFASTLRELVPQPDG